MVRTPAVQNLCTQWSDMFLARMDNMENHTPYLYMGSSILRDKVSIVLFLHHSIVQLSNGKRLDMLLFCQCHNTCRA